MRLRILRVLGLLFGATMIGSFAVAQMPMPTPSPTPPPTGGTGDGTGMMPPNYFCTDPTTGNPVPQGGSYTKVTNPTLTGGTQTVTEKYQCQGGAWALQYRETVWSSATGDIWTAPGRVVESGTRKEWFDTTTGCDTFFDEMIGRFTRVSTGFLTYNDDFRCFWNQNGGDCKNPESWWARQIERWATQANGPGATWSWANAGYKETEDNVGYDQTGKLVQDFHSSYKRNTAGTDGLIVTTVGKASFEINYFETGSTVAHPQSYSLLRVIGGGPNGGDVWSGQAQIPQYDPMGNFTGYGSLTIGQILNRAHTHEFFICGSDDGTGWPWWPLTVNPPIP